MIDAHDARLEPLRQFILPGGSLAAAQLHVARTACRRAERAAVALAADETVPAGALIFLNRLSDYLFTLARAANRAAGLPDVPWRGGKDV
jgi:cob(I)alamin adenosyltransferase